MGLEAVTQQTPATSLQVATSPLVPASDTDVMSRIGALFAKPAEEAAAEEQAEEPAVEPATAEPEPAAPTARERIDLAKALTSIQRIEGEKLAFKRELDALKAQHAELSGLVDKARQDPNELLRLGKLGAEQLGKLFLDGKLSFEQAAQAAQAELPADVKEAVEYAKQARAREAQQAEETAQRGAWEASLANVRSSLEQVGAEFPLLVALPSAADTLTRHVQTLTAQSGKEPDFRVAAKQMHDAVMGEMKALLKHDGAFKAALADKDVLDAVRKTLGAPTPAAKKAPATIAGSSVAAVPSRSPKPYTDAELADLINKGGAG